MAGEKLGDYSQTSGKTVQAQNINAAREMARIVKTTLGPKGMDKMLVDQQGHITITNDGYTILNEMDITHPAAKMIREIAKTQETEIGDGTTSAVMLAGKLLENAESLINKNIHPTVICKGYLLAAEESKRIIATISTTEFDDDVLESIAMTSMTGKAAEGSREMLAKIIVSAVNKVKDGDEIELGRIKIQTVTGSIMDNSELIEGVVTDRQIAHEGMPRKMENPKIALLDVGLEVKNPEMEIMSQVSTPEQLEAFRSADTNAIKKMVDMIINSGANVVLTQKGFDDLALHQLAKNGIIGIQRINKYDMDQLARSTGGRVVSSVDELTEKDLGKAGIIREVKNKESSLVYIEKCADAKAVTILVHSSTEHITAEISRAITDGIGDVTAAVNDKSIVPGGGAVEMFLSTKLKAYARTLSGREQLAVEKFAEALEFIPETLAENAGLDSINIITEIKQKIESTGEPVGLNLFTDKIEDTFAAGIIEPSKIKTQAINAAVEVAIMILRVDDLLLAKSNIDQQ